MLSSSSTSLAFLQVLRSSWAERVQCSGYLLADGNGGTFADSFAGGDPHQARQLLPAHVWDRASAPGRHHWSGNRRQRRGRYEEMH